MTAITTPPMRKKEFAARLNVTLRTVSGWVKVGVAGVKLRVSYVGTSPRFDWGDYLAFQAEADRRRGVNQCDEEE